MMTVLMMNKLQRNDQILHISLALPFSDPPFHYFKKRSEKGQKREEGMEKKEGKIGKFVTFFKFWVSFIGSGAKIILT